MAEASGLPHPHPGPVSGPQARAAPMPPTWCPCPVQRPHTPTPWPALHCPAGPGAVRGTRSPTGLTTSGLTGGVSGSRLFLGVSRVHSQGRRRSCWRPVETGSQAAGSTHKGETLKGSHAGPTSVVGRQGLGRPQLPYWSLPRGAASSKSSRPTTKHCRSQVANRLLPTCIFPPHLGKLASLSSLEVWFVSRDCRSACLDPGPDAGLGQGDPTRPLCRVLPNPLRRPAGHHSRKLWTFTAKLLSTRPIQLFPDSSLTLTDRAQGGSPPPPREPGNSSLRISTESSQEPKQSPAELVPTPGASLPRLFAPDLCQAGAPPAANSVHWTCSRPASGQEATYKCAFCHRGMPRVGEGWADSQLVAVAQLRPLTWSLASRTSR